MVPPPWKTGAGGGSAVQNTCCSCRELTWQLTTVHNFSCRESEHLPLDSKDTGHARGTHINIQANTRVHKLKITVFKIKKKETEIALQHDTIILPLDLRL